VTLSLSPNDLTAAEDATLDHFGNALVLLVSLAVIIWSSAEVRGKLEQVGELLPFKKYPSYVANFLGYIPLVNHIPRLHRVINRWRAYAYKSLSVKKMVHHYEHADELIIISGNYSWLFDNGWSLRAGTAILEKLPRVKLISWRSPQEVAEFWTQHPNMRAYKAIFESMQFTNSKNKYNGSIVREGQACYYIYLYPEAKGHKRSVCVFNAAREAGALVHLVEDELLRLHASGRRDGQLEEQKHRLLEDPNYFG
jgi:hypothetical protein